MKQNLLFNQLTAMPKRLAMVLTVLFTLGVGSMLGDITLTTSDVTLSNFSSFSGSGYKTVSNYTISNYSGFSVTDCMLSSSSLQMKASSGKLVSPTIISPAGFDIEITYTSATNMTVAAGGSSTTAASVLKLSTNSTSTSFTLSVGSKYAVVSKIVLKPKAGAPKIVILADDNTELIEASAGGGVNLPERDDCGDWTFVGWTEGQFTDGITNQPVIIKDNPYKPSVDITLYPVYSKTEGGSGNTTGSKTFTLSTIANANDWENGTAYTSIEDAPVTITAEGGGNNGKWYTSSNGSWRMYSGGTVRITADGGTITSVTSTPSCTFTINNGEATFSPSARTDFTKFVVEYTVVGASTTTYTANPDCTPTTYTVTFDANGHGTAPDEQTVTSGEKATEPDDPEETGYIFEGWFEYQSCTGNSFDFATTPITGDITLYAKWTAIQKTITLNANGGSGHTASVTATYDSNILDPSSITNPTQTGYTFDGWYSGEGGTGSLVINTSGQLQANVSGYTGDNGVWKATQNKTLYAKWTPIEYTITYNAGTGTCDQTTAVGTYPIGVTLPTSSPSSKCASEGWTFAGWAATTVSATSTAPTLYYAGDTYRPTADVELHAVYVKNTFILSLEHNSTTYYVGAYESSTSILKAETNRNNAVEFQIDDNYLRCESGYISHNSTSSTNISCYASKDKVYPWTITENAGEIIFQSTKAEDKARYLGFNYNNGNPRFAAYVNTYAHSLTKTSIFTYDSNPDCCSTIAPTNGAYSTDSDTEVILTWEDANNYGRYHITGGNLAAEGVYSENKNYTVSGLTKCQSYTFQVTAYPTDGCESPAITIEATPYKVKTVTFIDESSTTTQYTSCEAESVTVPTVSKDCYTSVWKDQDGKEYNSGATITPTKDLTLTAHYNIITYTIQFVDEDVLQSSTVDCGTTPSYTGATPTKASDEIYDYEFAGWDPTIVAAKSDATYTATYNKTKRTYTVQWYVNGVQYGTDQTVTAGETATAPAIAEVPCGAVIAGWTDAEGGNYVHKTSILHVGAIPSIEIRSNKIFYAVFADRETIIPKLPENIVYWENQEITQNSDITATIGDGTMTSNVTLDDPRDRTYYGSISTAAQISLENLNLRDYNNINLSFWARGSAKGTFTIVTDVDNNPIGTVTLTGDERLYIIENIPSNATSITLTYSANSGSLFFGTVKIYENTTAVGTFTKLTAENTNGWTGSDWDGYYLITNDQNNLLALDGNAIGEKSYQLVEAHDGIISSPIKTAFLVSYDEDEQGYSIKGIGDELYLGTANNSISVSKEPIYHKTIGYNQLKNSDKILSWNNSGSKFGFYGSIMTSAPQMYKIMSELSNHRTLCTYNIEYTNLEGTTHTNQLTYTAEDLPLTFTAPTSTREGYTFKGWRPAILETETRGDQVVEAQWTVNQYTVTWKLNGGQWQGGGTDDRVNNHNYGAEVTKPVDPSRTGYTFTGWSPAEIPATMPAENLEFTAQWTPTPYTVTWMLGGTEHATSTVNIENPLSTAPDNPSDGDLGCCADKFMGWSSQQSPSAGDIFTKDNIPSNVTTAKTYYAVFATTAQGVGTSIADFSEVGYENGTAVTDPIVLGDGEGHGDATITLAKAQSSKNDAKYYDDGEAVRIYAGGTITIASTYNNATIKNIVFTFAGNDVVGENTITASSGTYDNGTWTGDASTVTFTISGSTGHRRIASITVTTGVTGSQYTNYVTQCTALPDPALSGGSVPAIAVNCGDFSTLSNSQAIVFSTMQDLTCPVTFEVTEGNFLISTAKDRAAQYQSKVKVTPYKTGENTGKLKNVYVRANATNHNENFTGTIKVTSDEIAEDVIINLTANVTCEAFTITTVDHLGNETVSGTYFAGDVIATEPTPSSDACSKNYTFAGWSTSEVKYGSLIYNKVSFPYTMPAQDVTLYPVYECHSTADYHRVTYDLENNWAGDYLIAYSDNIFANGKVCGTDGIGKASNNIDLSKDISNNTINYLQGDEYKVTLEKYNEGYLLKTQDGEYNYYTNISNDNMISASATASTAGKYALDIKFESAEDIKLCLSGAASGSVFGYRGGFFRYFILNSRQPIYLYKKSPLYTTSLICEEVTASDALVTSTAGQTVKVNVIATMDNMTITRQRELTVESDHNDFAATITKTSETTYNVAVSYTPAAEQIIDGTDVANITIKVNNIPVNTFQVTGRHLPQNFVIAAKAGNEWVALTAKVSNGTQVAVPIIVDNKATPTKASVALNTTQYQLFGLKTNNRYTANGTAVHLYSTQTQKVLNASTAKDTKTYLNTYATHGNAEVSDDALFYEWQLVSEDLIRYTITNSNQTDGWENNRILGYSAATGMWGMYSKGTNINQDLFLLPVETVLTEIDMEVMEWGENSIALRIPTDAPENIQLTLGENTSEAKALTNLNADGSASDLYKVEGLTLGGNDCEVMMITDAVNPTSGTLIRKPIIVSGEAESTTYTSDDCPYCDVVVLKDAKLKAGSSHVDFANIYVYPGGKLVLDGNSLGVKQQVYLRGGYSWLNPSTYALPEVYLNGDINFNGSGNIIYDYYIQNYKYYQFALPYDVQLSKVTDEAGKDDFPVWVKHYNGSLRAADAYATSWEWYPSENGDANASFKAGDGYVIAAKPRQFDGVKNRPLSIIRFPLGNKVFNTTNGLEKEFSITTTAHGISGYNAGTVTANNVGWNFVGNPFLSTWKGDIGHKQLIKHPNEENWDGSYAWANSDVKYITIMSPEDGTDYAQYVAYTTELKPFFPFFMQETANGGTGTIDFATANRIQKAPAELYVDEPREAFVQIEIITDGVEDQAGVFVNDSYSDDIDFDDYEKMFGFSLDKSKLWLVHDDKRMAFEAMTEASASANIALGYRAPKTASYTFAINEDVSVLDEVVGVYLTDHELGVTDYNLLYNTYEFETEAANYNDKRFTIRIVLRDNSGGVVTGIDNLGAINEGIYKFIYQDKLYIYNGGIIYDATGKQVTTINK